MLGFLNRYFRPVTEKEYLHEWDWPRTATYTETALRFSGLDKDAAQRALDWIWEPERTGQFVKSIKKRR